MIRVSFAPFGWTQAVALSQTTGIDFLATDFTRSQWFCVSAFDRVELIGVCAFEFKTPFDAHMTCAIRDRRCMSRRLLSAMFTAVFSRATRITALVEPWNTTAIDQCRRMGFQPEGYLRRAVEGTRDAMLFGLLPEECRYLPQASPVAGASHNPEVRTHGQLA